MNAAYSSTASGRLWPLLLAPGLLKPGAASPVLPHRVHLQQIVESRGRIPELLAELRAVEAENAAYRRQIGELSTPEGVERAARERYGMIRPGEKVYIIPDASEDGDGRP